MQKQLEQVLSSKEVAQMVGKEHKNLMRDVRSYVEELAALKIEPSAFFREASYKDSTGRTLPCYDVTKKGCEFIANKLTGIKGTEFTALFINRFHDMEDIINESGSQKEIKQDKSNRTEIMMMNARSRMAQTYLKLSQVDTLSSTYKTVLVAKASEVLAGYPLLQLPKSERRVYTAKEIGVKFGISANRIGRIANEHHLKTSEYGEYRRDKSQYSVKEVDTWVYFDTVIPVVAEILGKEVRPISHE